MGIMLLQLDIGVWIPVIFIFVEEIILILFFFFFLLKMLKN